MKRRALQRLRVCVSRNSAIVALGTIVTLCASESVIARPGRASDQAAAGLLGQVRTLPATLYTGDWVEQTLEAPSDGDYDLVVDGTLSRGDHANLEKLQLDVDGLTVSMNIDAADASLYTASLLIHERLHLSAGSHVIRLLARQVAGHCEYWPWLECYDIPYRIDDFWLVPSATERASVVLAGATEPGFADGVGTNARFGTGFIASAGPDGSLLVGDSVNHRVRRVTPDGVVTTIAGNGNTGHTDGPALQATFCDFTGLIGTADGDVWILDNDPQVAGGDPERVYYVRRLSATGEVTTAWQGSIATGAPPYNPEYWLPNEHGAQFYLLHGLFQASGGALLLHGSYWFCWDYALETCDGGPCNIHTACRTDRDVILLMPNGSPEKTGEHWDSKQPVSNSAGVAFIVNGDRLLRQPPDGYPQTIYQNPNLRAVVSVRDEEVWVAEGARIMRVLDDTHPAFVVQVEVVGGTGRGDGIPAWPVARGTMITLTAVPTGEAQFSYWAGDATGSNPVMELRVDQDMMVEAHMGYLLEVLSSQATVGFEPDLLLYPLGLEVALSATPDAGLDSIRWSDGATARVRWVTVNGPLSIGVAGYRSSSELAAILQTNVLPTNKGRVDRTQFGPYQVGTPIWLSAVPSWGYAFVRWSDGVTEPQRVVYAPEIPLTLVAEFGAPPGAHPVIEAPGLTKTGKVRLVIRGEAGLRYGLQQRLGHSGWQTLYNSIMPATGEAEYWIQPVGQMGIYRAAFGL